MVRRLLHILNDGHISGQNMLALSVVQELTGYTHTAVILDEPDEAEQTYVWTLLAAGADVLYSDTVPYTYGAGQEEYAAILLHGLSGPNRVALPAHIPRIYYAYYDCDPNVPRDVTIFPSEYARKYNVDGRAHLAVPDDAEVVPPGINARTLRRISDVPDKKFTVGLLSTTSPGKYPIGLLDRLAKDLPSDIRIVTTSGPALKKYMGTGRIWAVPQMVDATLKGINMSNIVVYASAPGYFTPYGRTCMEALAAKRAVICESRGAPSELLQDGRHALMFDDYADVAKKILYLRSKPNVADKLAATGQVLASWHDVSVHAGELRGILHSLGA